jgi:hypothetical protein
MAMEERIPYFLFKRGFKGLLSSSDGSWLIDLNLLKVINQSQKLHKLLLLLIIY